MINKKTNRTAKDYPDNVLANIGYYEAIDHHHFVMKYDQQSKGGRDVAVAAKRCLEQMLAKGYDGAEMGIVFYDEVTHSIYIGKNEANRENGNRMTLKLITCIELQRLVEEVMEDGRNEWTVIASNAVETIESEKIIKLADIYDKVLMGLVFQFGLEHIIDSEQAISLDKFDAGISKFFGGAEDLFEWSKKDEQFAINFAMLKVK